MKQSIFQISFPIYLVRECWFPKETLYLLALCIILTFITFITKHSFVTSVWATSVHVVALLTVQTFSTRRITLKTESVISTFYKMKQNNICISISYWNNISLLNFIIILLHYYKCCRIKTQNIFGLFSYRKIVLPRQSCKHCIYINKRCSICKQ